MRVRVRIELNTLNFFIPLLNHMTHKDLDIIMIVIA